LSGIDLRALTAKPAAAPSTAAGTALVRYARRILGANTDHGKREHDGTRGKRHSNSMTHIAIYVWGR
jgi:hypothetical protein